MSKSLLSTRERERLQEAGTLIQKVADMLEQTTKKYEKHLPCRRCVLPHGSKFALTMFAFISCGNTFFVTE